MNIQHTVCTFISLLGSLVFVSCAGDTKQNPGNELPGDGRETVSVSKKSSADVGLTTYTVKMMPLTGALIAPAKVLPNQDLEAHIGSLVPGRVHRVFVNVGDAVTAGQVLMTVEGLDVGSIKAGYLKTKAAHNYAKTVYERQKKLFDEKIGSQKSMLESKAEYEKALAEFEAEDKKIHSVGLTDDEVTDGRLGNDHSPGTLPIKSPISGVVVERTVVIGQALDAAMSAFKVIDTRRVWIDAQIYEKDLAKINRMTTAVFTTASYPTDRFPGRIKYFGQTIDEQSRTIAVRCEIENASRKLKPQMFGELKIPLGSDANGLLVPEEAVQREGGETYVFIQAGDTTYEKRQVVTGLAMETMIEIKAGLKAGDAVVAKGVFYLKSGLKNGSQAGEEH
jgi:membrane fusion protein, heavy metal efflux system